MSGPHRFEREKNPTKVKRDWFPLFLVLVLRSARDRGQLTICALRMDAGRIVWAVVPPIATASASRAGARALRGRSRPAARGGRGAPSAVAAPRDEGVDAVRLNEHGRAAESRDAPPAPRPCRWDAADSVMNR
jgi:hypothetical protein